VEVAKAKQNHRQKFARNYKVVDVEDARKMQCIEPIINSCETLKRSVVTSSCGKCLAEGASEVWIPDRVGDTKRCYWVFQDAGEVPIPTDVKELGRR
jgi:hypothetical protein